MTEIKSVDCEAQYFPLTYEDRRCKTYKSVLALRCSQSSLRPTLAPPTRINQSVKHYAIESHWLCFCPHQTTSLSSFCPCRKTELKSTSWRLRPSPTRECEFLKTMSETLESSMYLNHLCSFRWQYLITQSADSMKAKSQHRDSPGTQTEWVWCWSNFTSLCLSAHCEGLFQSRAGRYRDHEQQDPQSQRADRRCVQWEHQYFRCLRSFLRFE